MLHNLICNAMEAASPATADISFSGRVIALDSREWMQLEISDRGPGFPAAILDRPFEPNVSHKPGGSGLGLAICRKIVAEHDGRIAICNPAGGGALVTIFLPLAKYTGTGHPLP
jgi:signal transduction histidine kinase